MRKGLITVEFGELVNLGKDKFNPMTNANMPCIELEHIDSGTGTINGSVDSREQKSLKNVFHKGDILFSKLRPYLRKYWFADFDGVCSSEIWVLKPKEIVLPQYLFYLIQTEEFIRISNVSSGSKMPRADWDFINHYPLTIIHSIPEQQRIVSVLSLWDTAIAKQTALIEKLTLRKRGLMQQLLTGKKRLEGFSGEWKEVRLGEITLVIGGGTPNTGISDYWNGNIPWFTPSEIGENKYVNISERTISEKGLNDSSAKLLPKGTILFTSRATIGAKAILTTEATTNQGFQSLVVTDENNNEFIYYYLDIILNEIKQKASGSTFPEVSAESIRKIKVVIPNLEEQTAIASVLVNADKEIEIQKQKLAAMQVQKKGLMQQLLTGKKRIEI